jgi:hypothetical protein
MSIQSIDAISRPGSIDRWQYAKSFSNMPPQMSSPMSSQIGPLMQQMMMLMQMVLGAAQSLGGGDPYGGGGGANPYGGGGASPYGGGADPYGGGGSNPYGGGGGMNPYGGGGGMNPYGGAGGTSPYGGVGGTDPAQGLNGASGSNPLSALMASLTELFNALAPLLQALGQNNGLKPNDAANDLANKLGGAGGAGGGGNSGSGGGSGGGGSAGTGSSGGAGGSGHAGGSGGSGGKHSGTTAAPSPAPASGGTHPSTSPSSTSPAGSVKPTEIPPAKGTVIVNEPIVVKAGVPFDGGGKLYQAGPALGDGGQSETQKPVFILEPGATLQNVQVAGGDGVHTKGDATLKDVWWKDVGEDAMTMKGPGNVKVIGGGAYNATDKIFQINNPGSLSIEGFTADTFGKAVRTNGGKDFPITIDIKNSVFRNGDEAVVRTDASQAKVNLENVTVDNVPNDVLTSSSSTEVTGAQTPGHKAYTG